MVNLVVASVVLAAAMQTAQADSSRKAFTACIRAAVQKATADKMSTEAFAPFIRQSCDAPAGALKNGLVAFDTKNGIGRARAASDAQQQINDYYSEAADRLKMTLEIASAPK